MKRKLLLITAISFCLQSRAQYIDENSTAPVKLADVVEKYLESDQHLFGEDEEEEHGMKEGKDYHFNRWIWYWQQHTDANGYMVSPVKTYTEWLKYNSAQQKTTAGNSSNWAFQGPANSAGGYHGIGRISNIAFHPTDPNTYWVCTAGGGLWKTTNDGINWTNLTNALPVLGTSDMKVNPLNPNTMYLCTGDRDASDTYSIGVMKSTDGGATWTVTGLNWTASQFRLTNSIVINKTDTNSLTVATSNGIYKSYNGGTSWTQVQTGNFKQVLYHPTDTSIMYATVFNGSVTADIYRSKNGGASWTKITNFSNKKRITLAVTPANVAIVKAIVATNNGGLDGIYNSTDTGKTFTKIYGPSGCNGDLISGNNSNTPNTCGNQGWYDLAIAIDPGNANKVFVGGVNTWYSTNGGTSWNICTQWYAQMAGVAEVHADKHWQAFHPLVANRFFECNDGGLYKSNNPGPASLWNDLTNGLGITQFYRNAVTDNANFVLGGAQDNGTKMLQSGSWSDPNGGDGMDCQIDYANPATFYTATQNGSIDRTSTVWGDAQISDYIPGNPTGAWITPYIVSPHNHDHLIAGYKHIYFSADAGDHWISIAGVPLDPNRFLSRVAMTPAKDSAIYAVAENSKKVFYTYSFVPGNTTTFDSVICPLTGGNISDIKIDPKNHKHFWITMEGYGSSQVVEYKNNTWNVMNTGLPDVPVHCIELDSSNNIMYVGTDIGVFYLDTVNKQWAAYNNNLPSIEVADLGINYTAKEIWAATYGRGMWKSTRQEYVISPDTTDTGTIVTIIPYAADNISIAPNPSQGHFTITAKSTQLFGKPAGITILDNTGKVAWKSKQVFDASGMMNVNAETLAKGAYILSIDDGDNAIARKRIIIN